MKCNWCNKGSGKNYTKGKGMTYYYVCMECVGDFAEDKSGYYEQMETDKINLRNLKVIESSSNGKNL